MSIPLTINGQVFQYPETGDSNWGVQATQWASAVSTGLLQKTGGLFTLISEVDFGASFGLKSLYYKTRTASVASAGQFRLARTDVVSWRNQAGDGDLDLAVNSSNVLIFNGTAIGNFVTVSDTNSIDLTLTLGALSSDLKLSSAAATAGYFKATSSIETDGLLVQAQNAATAQTGFLTATDWNTFNNKAPSTRLINTTAPLTGGGDLSSDRTIAIPVATSIANGYLSSTDWSTFNAKQTAGNYITALSGDVVAAGPGSAAATIQAGVIVNSMISASAAIAFSKLATLTSGNILVGSAGNVATSVAMSGDATIIASGAITIANNAVTNAKAAQMAANSIKGNNTGGAANAIDLTATQATAMLNAMVGDTGSGGTKGLVPAPATGDATKFLNGAGAWSSPAGAGDVVGPAAATANAPALYNGTTGKLIKDSGALGANGTFYSVVAGVPAWATLTAATTSTAGTVTNQASGTFTATFTQAGGYSQAVTVRYKKVNDLVTLSIPGFTGTSTATAPIDSGATDVPSDLRPTAASYMPVFVIEGGTNNTPGVIEVGTGGQLRVFRTAASPNWGGSGNAGLVAGVRHIVTYTLN